MAEGDSFGAGPDPQGGFGSGLSFGGAVWTPEAPAGGTTVTAQVATPQQVPTFGSGLGPPTYSSDPQATALDQSADLLQQRINRANSISSNPLASFFNPEGVQKAREFIPQATEQLLQLQKQKQQGQDFKNTARNMGLTNPDQFGPASTNETLANEALRQWKEEGNFNAYKGLQGLSPEWAARAQLYMPEAMGKFADHVEGVQKGITQLNAGAMMNSQKAYKEARDSVIRDNDLGSLGIKPQDIPETLAGWAQKRGAIETQYSMAQRTINSFRAQQDRLGQAVPISDDKVSKATESQFKFSNGETFPGFSAVTLPGYGDVPGVMGPPKSKDIDERGKSWSNAGPDQVKAVNDQLRAPEVGGAISKYKMARDFYNTATNDKLYRSAAGLALISDELGAIGRDVAEGSKAAGSIGLTKMLEAKYGTIDSARNKLEAEKSALREWIKGGGPANPRLSPPSIEGIKEVAAFKRDQALQEVKERVTGPLKTAGRYGIMAGDLGLDKELINSDELGGAYRSSLKESNDALKSYPRVTVGDHLVLLPPGSNVPGAQQPLTTPVQQATQSAPSPGSPATPPGPSGSAAVPTPSGPEPGGGPAPGLTANYTPNMRRIESGASKDPYTATTPGSSASGAYQMIDSTWMANRPPGATATRAKDATPEQQDQANETLTQKNVAALKGAGLPVNDTNAYIAHNLGAGGAAAMLRAAPNADARTVVGEAAAKNNPLFFRGKPTVATVLARYEGAMNGTLDTEGPKKPPPYSPTALAAAGVTQEPNGLLRRIASKLASGDVPGGRATTNAARQDVADNGPAIGSTLGAVGGSVAGPLGTIAGGAAGGSAGQALKDYLQGNPQSPVQIAKEGALGGVLGVGGPARPFLGAAARAAGAGAVEGGAAAVEGGDAGDVAEAAGKGVLAAAGGEAFGRALGMVGHKIFSMFAPDAQKAVQAAAAKYADATKTLETETPKLPSVGGAAGGPNPKYAAAETAKAEAETVLKDAGLKPEEAAYAHKVSSEPPTSRMGVQEAEVGKPGAAEQARVGQGYQQLESEVGAAGVGAPKAAAKLPDGSRAAVENKKVSADHAELADHVEMAITAPAKNWQEKWVQLKDARSQLLQAERDAMASTAPGKSKIAADMRTLADTVRVQQAKAAKYVFGEKDGEAFMGRLKVLDTRYRNLMEATNGGDLAAAAAMKGEAGREADRKFRAFAHDDPAALAAWTAMRRGGSNVERDVRTLVGAEKLPGLGHAISAWKLLAGYREYLTEKAAGNPVKFEDIIKAGGGEAGQKIRDILGSTAARGAAM